MRIKGNDALRVAVLGDSKLILRQIFDGRAATIGYNDIDGYFGGTGFKGWHRSHGGLTGCGAGPGAEG